MIFGIALLYLLRGSLFTLDKIILQYVEPLLYVAFRMLFGGALLLTFFLYRYRGKFVHTYWKGLWGENRGVTLRIIGSFSLHLVAFFWSLHYITSIDSALIFNITPFAAAYFSYTWFGEKMTVKKTIGLLLGLISLVPIYAKHVIAEFSMAQLSLHQICTLWLPLAAMTLSALCSAYRWVMIRDLVKKKEYPVTLVNGVTTLVVAFCMFALVPFVSFMNGSPLVTNWGMFGRMLLIIIFLGNILADNLYAFLLRHYTATLISFAGFIRPFFVAAFGIFFLGEQITPWFVVALSLVIVGIYMFYREELRQGYVNGVIK